MRRLFVKIIMALFLFFGLSAISCTPQKNMTGKQYIKKQQKELNWEAWKKRNKRQNIGKKKGSGR